MTWRAASPSIILIVCRQQCSRGALRVRRGRVWHGACKAATMAPAMSALLRRRCPSRRTAPMALRNCTVTTSCGWPGNGHRRAPGDMYGNGRDRRRWLASNASAWLLGSWGAQPAVDSRALPQGHDLQQCKSSLWSSDSLAAPGFKVPCRRARWPLLPLSHLCDGASPCCQLPNL